MNEIETYPDADRLARAAAEHFVALAAEAIAARGLFTVALSGGSTPRAAYALLASDEFAAQVDWPRVHVFWGDERCVPPDHPDSNYSSPKSFVKWLLRVLGPKRPKVPLFGRF
jgi:6-phosphogluconolactonase